MRMPARTSRRCSGSSSPGSLAKSRLLVHPLAQDAGGDFYHNGGKHWRTQNDAEWQTLKAWVFGEKAAPADAEQSAHHPDQQRGR